MERPLRDVLEPAGADWSSEERERIEIQTNRASAQREALSRGKRGRAMLDFESALSKYFHGFYIVGEGHQVNPYQKPQV